MKLAFTTEGKDPGARLDPSFGRAPAFLLYDEETDAFELVSNVQNLNAAQGAGIQAAQTLVKVGAGALITGHCGPKAFRVLAAADVQVFNTDAPTVQEALRRFRAGTLVAAAEANIESHWV